MYCDEHISWAHIAWAYPWTMVLPPRNHHCTATATNKRCRLGPSFWMQCGLMLNRCWVRVALYLWHWSVFVCLASGNALTSKYFSSLEQVFSSFSLRVLNGHFNSPRDREVLHLSGVSSNCRVSTIFFFSRKKSCQRTPFFSCYFFQINAFQMKWKWSKLHEIPINWIPRRPWISLDVFQSSPSPHCGAKPMCFHPLKALFFIRDLASPHAHGFLGHGFVTCRTPIAG